MSSCKLLEFKSELIKSDEFFYAKGIRREFEIKYKIVKGICEVFAYSLEIQICKDVHSAKEFCNKVNEADFQDMIEKIKIWGL